MVVWFFEEVSWVGVAGKDEDGSQGDLGWFYMKMMLDFREGSNLKAVVEIRAARASSPLCI